MFPPQGRNGGPVQVALHVSEEVLLCAQACVGSYNGMDILGDDIDLAK